MEYLPVVAIIISLLTMALTYYKFGREVHIDDKKEILRQLAECRQRCDEMHREHQDVMAEDRRLREENYGLYQRLNSPPPPRR